MYVCPSVRRLSDMIRHCVKTAKSYRRNSSPSFSPVTLVSSELNRVAKLRLVTYTTETLYGVFAILTNKSLKIKSFKLQEIMLDIVNLRI